MQRPRKAGLRMRYAQMPPAEARLGDDPKMIEAIGLLAAAGVDVRRPPNSSYQLKVSPLVSYYPGRETIVVDGEPSALRQRGFAALIAFLDAGPEATTVRAT